MRKRNLTLPLCFSRMALSWAGAASVTLSLLALTPAPAAALVNLLTNGDFESGLTGWTTADQITGPRYVANDPLAAQGSFYSTSYTDSRSDPGVQFTAPISQLYSTPDTTALTGQGSSFAVSDMNAPGSHVLYQLFVAPAATLRVSWSQFVYDWSGADPADAFANSQYGRVDLLTASAISGSPFSTASAFPLYGPGVDAEASQGADPQWRNYSFDATGLTIGQSYALRFAVTDQQITVNMAVDNAGVFDLNPAAPEPGTAVLLLPVLLTAGTLVSFRRSRRSAASPNSLRTSKPRTPQKQPHPPRLL